MPTLPAQKGHMTVQITGVYMLSLRIICQYLASKVVHTRVIYYSSACLGSSLTTVQWRTSLTEQTLTRSYYAGVLVSVLCQQLKHKQQQVQQRRCQSVLTCTDKCSMPCT